MACETGPPSQGYVFINGLSAAFWVTLLATESKNRLSLWSSTETSRRGEEMSST